MSEKLPHILLITCHDLGRHLGCYGVPTVRTPSLDALAAGGIRLERAFATAPSCSPSRAAIATGRYPHSNGVMGLAHPPFDWDLHADERHIAGILRDAGYQTHLFGFQHVTPHPARLGFDELHGFDQLRGCYEPALGAPVAERVAALLADPLPDRPLYLEVNLEEPHRPYDQGGATPDEERGVWIPPCLPEGAAAREEMAALQGAIRQADRAIGRMLAALDAAGLAGSTLVVFLADHGLAMPRAKCTLYDPGIEVALLLRWPDGGIAGGRTCPHLVSNVDLLPTLLAAAGLPAPGRTQGRSFLPALRGEPFVSRTAVYAEKTFHSYYDPMRAIRSERFKYIRNRETAFAVEVPADVEPGAIFRSHVERYHGSQHPPAELYDLDADPLEQHNLSGDPHYREIERRLGAQLRTWMVETGDPLLSGPIASPAARQAWQVGVGASEAP